MVKRFLKLFGIVLLLVIIGVGIYTFVNRSHKKELIPSSSTTAVTEKTNPTPKFNKTQLSITESSSVWAVVNKRRPLNPATYIPADLTVPNVPLRVPGDESMKLRLATSVALEQLFSAAKTEGLNLMLSSGYRSFSFQTTLYSGYVAKSGQTEADKTSARPGYSEHQTGLAADIEPGTKKCEIDVCFADLPEGIWLASNAYKYGFVIRYPKDKTSTTGYLYEPWHVRFVGTDLSNEMHTKNIETLEEFFGLEAAPNYSS